MAHYGYYEKKLEKLERKAAQLKEQKRILELQKRGTEKILISPFALQKMIKEQERINRQLLKERNFKEGK